MQLSPIALQQLAIYYEQLQKDADEANFAATKARLDVVKARIAASKATPASK